MGFSASTSFVLVLFAVFAFYTCVGGLHFITVFKKMLGISKFSFEMGLFGSFVALIICRCSNRGHFSMLCDYFTFTECVFKIYTVF